MSVQIQVPEGYKLEARVSTKIPEESFHSIEMIPTERPWWKFWLPEFLYSYTVLEEIKDE